MGQNDKVDYVNTNNFYSSKNTIRKKKRQATKWEETFQIHMSDKDEKNLYPACSQNSFKS